MIAKIRIHGHIGPSYVDQKGQAHIGVELMDVVTKAAAVPAAQIIEVSINSPGGYADIGDDIYDYLMSLKKEGKQIVTIQDGLIGSIATKIFLAGDRRIADDRYEFWIHNPFVQNFEGDADKAKKMLSDLEQTEKDLRKLYRQYTPVTITDSALDGLMKNETGLTAEQCLQFGFATERKTIPVFNIIQKKKMEDKTIKEKVLAALGITSTKPIAPKPVTKVEKPTQQIKNVLITLAGGAGSIWFETEDPANLDGVSAFMVDDTGQPTTEAVPDGDYQLEDGRVVTIAGGVVTAVSAPQGAEATPTFTQAQVEEMINAAIEKAKTEVKSEAEKVADEKILAFKKTLVIGKQPPKGNQFGIINNGGSNRTLSPIQAKMKEIEEKRKKKLSDA